MKPDRVTSSNEQLTFLRDGAVSRGDVSGARGGGLNAFFANSVNSLSMSMVNFSCCVRTPPDVTREVTALPTRSAVRMESGVHAGV